MNILAANLWALHARAAAEAATERAASIITSLILRRRYPVPVTLDDLYRAIVMADMVGILTPEAQRATTAAMKQVTNAIDEVYAVVDGREVRVAIVHATDKIEATGAWGWGHDFGDLIKAADEQGYWERPHEVRLSRDELRTEGVG